MIVFDLKCGKDHVFEAWFKDNATFEKQRRAKDISCPTCGENKIKKAPMAPNIAVGAAEKNGTVDKATTDAAMAEKVLSTCRALRDAVERVVIT